MSLSQVLPGAGGLDSRKRGQLLWGILAAEVLVLCVPGLWWGYTALVLVAMVSLLGVILSVVNGRANGLILGWVLLFPLGYYCVSFPRTQPVITFDRIVIGLLLVAACLAGGHAGTRIPSHLRKAAGLWCVFIVVAACTIPRVKSPLNGLRTVVEVFIFPGLLAWFVLRHFDVRRNLSKLHVVVCVMSIYVGLIGAAEVFLQRDLLALPESSVILAGDMKEESSAFWMRPNGPFSTTNSYALVGLVSFLFLLFLRHALADRLPRWQKVLHQLGLVSAVVAALLPLFRSVVMALVLTLVIDAFYKQGLRRILRLATILSLALVALVLQLAMPQVLEDRTDPGNLYGRIAEQQQVMAMFFDHPLNGVGINNFYEAAQRDRYVSFYEGIESVDYPHSNLSAVLAETGISGFVPYILSQVLLLVAFWKIRQGRSSDAGLVWKYFVLLFLAYWVNGVSLTSGYYADLNLWYMLALAILYKYAATEPRPTQLMSAA